MSPGAATYKILHGLGLFYNKAVIRKLQKNSFSVNIEKCTASNGMKVFTILVSYFNEELEQSTVQHYKFIDCIDISPEILSEKILNDFIEDNIPLENLISDLSHHASYICGGKSCIEKRFVVTNIYKYFNFQVSIISCKPGSWFL